MPTFQFYFDFLMLHKTKCISFMSVCCCYFISLGNFCGLFFLLSVGRVKLSKFGIFKQTAAEKGVAESPEGRERSLLLSTPCGG